MRRNRARNHRWRVVQVAVIRQPKATLARSLGRRRGSVGCHETVMKPDYRVSFRGGFPYENEKPEPTGLESATSLPQGSALTNRRRAGGPDLNILTFATTCSQDGAVTWALDLGRLPRAYV